MNPKYCCEVEPEDVPDLVAVVRCKDCKHRPEEPEGGANTGFDYIFPDNVCPCKCDGDEWYSWRPSDNWFCPKGERKDGDGDASED